MHLSRSQRRELQWQCREFPRRCLWQRQTRGQEGHQAGDRARKSRAQSPGFGCRIFGTDLGTDFSYRFRRILPILLWSSGQASVSQGLTQTEVRFLHHQDEQVQG